MNGTPKTLTEAISNGLNEGIGKTHPEVVISIELAVRDYLANKAFSRDLELDRAFKIFFDKVCNKTIQDEFEKGAQ